MSELQQEKQAPAKHKASINVDIGGTFTDCLIVYDDQMVFGKAPTTTYDLSKGFMQALRETVGSLNITLEAFDMDEDDLTYTVVQNPTKGTLSGQAPNLIYTPQSSFTGRAGLLHCLLHDLAQIEGQPL